MIEPAVVLRCSLFLFVGIVGLGWLSGRIAISRRDGLVPIWIVVLAVAAVIMIVAAASVIGGALKGASIALGPTLSTVIGLAGFLLASWVSSIAVQLSQNAFYRRLGAPVQPIRWKPDQRLRRRRPRP